MYVRLRDGKIKPGDKIKFMSTSSCFDVVETGYLSPLGLNPSKSLSAGEVGYIAASIKNVRDARVGDTITLAENGAKEPLPGYKKVNFRVYTLPTAQNIPTSATHWKNFSSTTRR